MPRLIRLIISIGLIIGVMSQVGGEVIDRLRAVDWRWLLLALPLTIAQVAMSAARWRYTAQRLGVTIPRGQALSEYYLATLVNQVLPGGMVGDAQRAWRHSNQMPQRSPAFQAVVIERFSGQMAMALLALLAWALAPWPGALALGVTAPVISASAAGLLLVAAAGWLLHRQAPSWWQALQQALLAPKALGVQSIASLSVALSIIAVYACCVLAGTPTGSPLLWLALIPVVLFTMVIPLSIAGWGLRESAAALLWPLAGLPAAEGVSAAILYGGVSLVASLPGVITLLRR